MSPRWAGYTAILAVLAACGGEVAAFDAGSDASSDQHVGDAAPDRTPLNACELAADRRECPWARCQWVDKPASCPGPFIPGGDLPVYYVREERCVPRLPCVDDGSCPSGQRCVDVVHSVCYRGTGCGASSEFSCRITRMCIYDGFP